MRPPLPNMHGMPDAFAPQRLAEMPVVVQERIVVAHRQHDLQPPQMLQNLRISQIGHEMAGGVHRCCKLEYRAR